MATQVDIYNDRGDTLILKINAKDDAGANLSLTGAEIEYWIGRSALSTGVNVFVKKVRADMSIVGSQIVITTETDDTDGISGGVYYHECKVTLSGNVVQRLIKGVYELGPTIIRNS